MAKWKPTPPKTDAIIRAGRQAKSYRVSLDVEKRFKRRMRLYAILPMGLGFAAAYGVQQIFFMFILPLMVSWIYGLGNYPNVYLAAIYGFGVPIFLVAGRFMAYRFGDKLIAGMTPLDEGLSLLQQRAETIRNRGKRHLVGLVAVAGIGIYYANAQTAKIWYLLTLVCVALIIERFVLPGRYPLPQAKTAGEE